MTHWPDARSLRRHLIIPFLCVGLITWSGFPASSKSNDENDSNAAQSQAVTSEPIAGPPIDADQQVDLAAVWRVFGIDASMWRLLEDGVALADTELEPVYRVLTVLRRLNEPQRATWRRPFAEAAPWALSAQDFRGQMVSIQGEVLTWRERAVPIETARRFQLPHLYEILVRIPAHSETVWICTAHLPARWIASPPSASVGSRIACDAIFLKVGVRSDRPALGSSNASAVDAASDSMIPSLVFATDRIAWYPTSSQATLKLSPGEQLLGEARFDVDLLSQAVQRQKIAMGADGEAFYQLLAAMAWVDQPRLHEFTVTHPFDLATALQTPEKISGHAVRIAGVARRALKIIVEDPALQTRLGYDHYYEIDVLLPFRERLRLVDPSTGATRDYSSFPVTICTRQIPTDLPQGDFIRQPIVADAFFFKLWSYRSEFMEQSDPGITGSGQSPIDGNPLRQVSPLLVAPSVSLEHPPSLVRSSPRWSLGTAIAIAAGGVALAFGVGRLVSPRRRRTALAKRLP